MQLAKDWLTYLLFVLLPNHEEVLPGNNFDSYFTVIVFTIIFEEIVDHEIAMNIILDPFLAKCKFFLLKVSCRDMDRDVDKFWNRALEVLLFICWLTPSCGDPYQCFIYSIQIH